MCLNSLFCWQDQISDQDHVIAMHRAHTADLQVCLNSTNVELLKVNLEVQKVLKEIRIQSENQVVNIGGRDGCDGSGQKKQLANSVSLALTYSDLQVSHVCSQLYGESLGLPLSRIADTVARGDSCTFFSVLMKCDNV